jgi:hypothetical protein
MICLATSKPSHAILSFSLASNENLSIYTVYALSTPLMGLYLHHAVYKRLKTQLIVKFSLLVQNLRNVCKKIITKRTYSDLAAGLYIVQIGKNFTYKIMIRRNTLSEI